MRKIIVLTIVLIVAIISVFALLSSQRRVAKAEAPQLILYSGENFTGQSVTITDTTFDLPVVLNSAAGEDFNWNDEIRSLVIVSGTWRLYQHGRCNTQLDDTQADDTKLIDFNVKEKPQVGGWSALLSGLSSGPLQIPTVAAGGIWRDVSSIELVSTQNLPDWAMDFRK